MRHTEVTRQALPDMTRDPHGNAERKKRRRKRAKSPRKDDIHEVGAEAPTVLAPGKTGQDRGSTKEVGREADLPIGDTEGDHSKTFILNRFCFLFCLVKDKSRLM